jgi:hypothetical protein
LSRICDTAKAATCIEEALMQNTNNTLQSVLATIIAEREHWELNELSASNKRLYSILARCYAVFVDNNKTDDGRKAINDAAAALNVSFNEVTSTAAKVIKIIFGDGNRHQVSDYAKVLKIADAQDVGKADFEAWLSNSGGVYAVRRGNSLTPEQKQTAQTNAYSSGLAKLQQVGSIGSIAPHANVTARNGYVLAVCYVDANGALSVIQTVGNPDSDQVKAEIRRIGNDKAKSGKSTTTTPAPTSAVVNIAAAKATAQADALQAAINAGSDLNHASNQQSIAA